MAKRGASGSCVPRPNKIRHRKHGGTRSYSRQAMAPARVGEELQTSKKEKQAILEAKTDIERVEVIKSLLKMNLLDESENTSDTIN